MDTPSNIERRVMRRVHFLWWVRRISHPLILRAGLFTYSVVHLSYMVSYPDIMRNTLGVKVYRSPTYLGQAFLNTDILSQALIVAACATGAWLMLDTSRTAKRLPGRFLRGRLMLSR